MRGGSAPARAAASGLVRAVLVGAAVAAAGCAGAQRPAPIPRPPAPATRATLVGPLCDAGHCKCRQDVPGGDAGKPPKGRKRYEIRLGPTGNELWATVDDMVLYKSKERATACFYVDLTPGAHAVTLRAHEPHGFGARIAISELGAKGPWWYHTFLFDCGAPGTCDRNELAEFRTQVVRVEHSERHLFDPCGSTKVRRIHWQIRRMPDDLHPSDLLLRLVLDVYKFAPQHPSGNPACAGRAGQPSQL